MKYEMDEMETDGLIKELRDFAHLAAISKDEEDMLAQAADTIEILSEENKRLMDSTLPFQIGDRVYAAYAWGVEGSVVGSIQIMKDDTYILDRYGSMIGSKENVFKTQEEAEAMRERALQSGEYVNEEPEK